MSRLTSTWRVLRMRYWGRVIDRSGLFDAAWYFNAYPDLNPDKIDPILHYLEQGASEGRSPSAEFDSSWYVKTHQDVAESGVNPLLHYIWHGQKEGRKISPALQAGTALVGVGSQPRRTLNVISAPTPDYVPAQRIGVVLHAYYLDLVPGILSLLENISFDYELFVTTPAAQVPQLEALLATCNQQVTIVETRNLGYDLLPFIELVPHLQRAGVDLVLKIHTKKGGANLDHLFPDLGDNWAELLLKPLLGSPQVVADTVYAFDNDPDLGMIGPASLYKSYRELMHGNEVHLAGLVTRLNLLPALAAPWGFFAGTMFWCRVSLLEPLLPLVTDVAAGDESQTGQVASYWHALERLLGYLPRARNMRTGLSFALDISNHTHAVVALDEGQQGNYMSDYGVGYTLMTDRVLAQDYEFLQRELADIDFPGQYTRGLEMDPVLYYLRYGALLGHDLLEWFNSRAYIFTHPDVAIKRVNPLVQYLRVGRDEGEACFPSNDAQAANYRVVSESGLFDANYYLRNHPAVAASGKDPLAHFCKSGWRELKDPGPDFDVWDYWQAALDPRQALINPLVHKVLAGAGDPACELELAAGLSYPQPRQPTRVCLFAGYDPQGLVDQTVVDYLQELGRFADVYYLADCDMPEAELARLAGLTRGAWAFRHGAYDFGSYARLALDLVGWERLLEYDEVILANDSCYLLRPLDEVFAKMDGEACDWWGMQATKGIARTRNKPANQFQQELPLAEVKQSQLAGYEQESFYDFLIGSYFLVFRKPVLEGAELKRLLGYVQPEQDKLAVIRKYEIGLTRSLIRAGYNFSTFIEGLLPFHPIYSERHFDLIARGFPLFKRYLLTENHYHVPALHDWAQRLTALVPGLDTAPMIDNLYRICDNERLHRNLNISREGASGWRYPTLLSDKAFTRADRKTAKHGNWWVFPVCAFDHNFSGNERAVFEAVKHDPSIRKIVLLRSKYIKLDGVNIEVVQHKSRAGQDILLQSAVIFIKHSVTRNAVFPLAANRHYLINLWHGIPLKRIGVASLDSQLRLDAMIAEHRKMHSVICSSDIDRMAMTVAFKPLGYDDIWLTGLPRIDFILMDESRLPAELVAELARLDEMLNGRQLLLFCPTFRNQQDGAYYQPGSDELTRLGQLLAENNYVLGIREHMADTANSYGCAFAELGPLDLGGDTFRHIEAIYRRTSVLLTDYSSCLVDFMVTGRPIVSFAYDLEQYTHQERGFFYDLDFAVPGPVCRNFDELVQALAVACKTCNPTTPVAEPDPQYLLKRQMFFKYLDADNSNRVIDRVKALPPIES